MNKYESIANKVLKNYPDVTIQYYKTSRPWNGICYPQQRLIKVSRPVSLIALNTLFHELGHLKDNHKLSCMNEYEACKYAESQLKAHGIKVTREIKSHNDWYIAYSLAQAMNRNLKTIPTELRKYRKLLREYEVHLIYGNGNKKIVKRYRAIKS